MNHSKEMKHLLEKQIYHLHFNEILETRNPHYPYIRKRFHLYPTAIRLWHKLLLIGFVGASCSLGGSYRNNVCLNYSRLSSVSMVKNHCVTHVHHSAQLRNFSFGCHFTKMIRYYHEEGSMVHLRDHRRSGMMGRHLVRMAVGALARYEQMNSFCRTCIVHLSRRICSAMSCSCCKGC